MWAIPRALQPMMATTTFSFGLLAARSETAAPKVARPAVRTELCFRKSRRLIELIMRPCNGFGLTLARKLCSLASRSERRAGSDTQIREGAADGVDDLNEAGVGLLEALHGGTQAFERELKEFRIL